MGCGNNIFNCVCKGLLLFWTIILMLASLTLMVYLAVKVTDISKRHNEPVHLTNLLSHAVGSGIYSELNTVQLNRYTWFSLLGLSTLAFIACLIHVISTCKSSRCLLGLGTFLLMIVFVADIAGVVYRNKAEKSINNRLSISLNNTIINMYGKPEFPKVTEEWNRISEGSEGRHQCCGILSGTDFKHAQYWSGNITAGQAPCLGRVVDEGCMETISRQFITIDNPFLTILVAAKASLVGICILSTFCACPSFNKGDDDEDELGMMGSYDMVDHARRRRARH